LPTLFENCTLLTCDADERVVAGSLLVEDGHIADLGDPARLRQRAGPTARIEDLGGRWLMPGLVQTHIHLVQTLFRGMADDLALLDWLAQRIWPLERAHDRDSVYWSARLGLSELLLGGTTALLDMGTVDHTDAVFEAAAEAGLRAHVGKAMMDVENEAGLSEPTEQSLQSAMDLRDRWHGRGLLHYAFAPRFVPSCSERLLRETAAEARRTGCRLHTHASENRDEVALVRQLRGMDNVRYLDEVGFSGPDVVLAHCVHLSDEEVGLLAARGTVVAHCPSSNLKLASGVADLPRLLGEGVHCTLGADGAPCNNRLDAFAEMRLAALLQKPRHGPRAMRAGEVLRMATAEGARALGTGAGVLAPGRPADLVELDPDVIFAWGGGDPVSAVVYALGPAAVRRVWVAGRLRVAGGAVLGWDGAETVAGCRQALARVRGRAGL
jgi:5-methylthioadenosine/S-adenosylhomocysteine deaminase